MIQQSDESDRVDQQFSGASSSCSDTHRVRIDVVILQLLLDYITLNVVIAEIDHPSLLSAPACLT